MDMRYAGRGGVGGGCVSRYFGGGLYDISMVDRMMLKFRPIAPKPVGSGSGSGDSTVVNGGGGKRRYVRVNGNNRNKDNKKRKVSTPSFQPTEVVSSGGDAVVTLSLMPETPDRKDSSPSISSSSESPDIVPVKKVSVSSPIWLNFKNNNQMARDRHVKITHPVRQKAVSSVTVEWVTETCVGKGWVGWREMESDTCPGFISDGADRVVWTNKAYREMAGGEEVVVVLVRKDGCRPGVGYPAAFTCNARVTCGSGTTTVPCDAWRMEGSSGYAWRLDIKAALSLGR